MEFSREMTKKLQALLSPIRRAINDYNMIEDGDKIALGLSGGKDSLALLVCLATYKKFSPNPFDLIAINIDLGLGTDKDQQQKIIDLCKDLEVPLYIVESQIGPIIFDERKETSPCSLCSKMRRGALCTKANELNANKIALAHHADDLMETMLLSMFYEGRISTFAPVSYMDRTKVSVIRPMVYVEEKEVIGLAKHLPVLTNPCCANHTTQREYMKNLLKKISKDIPIAKDRFRSAITHPERNNLWTQKKDNDL